MIEPSLQIGGGNWANKSDSLLGYHKDGANFYADELTFSRNSLGSYTDANGLVQTMPYNLLTYSEQFDNAAWSPIDATITANAATAPNGTTTADKIDLGTLLYSQIAQEVATIGENNFSIYIQSLTGTQNIYLYSYNATDGIAISPAFAIGTSWTRIDYTFSVTTSTLFGIRSEEAIAKSFYIWGAQVNIGSTALPYFATTTRFNLARVDYKDNVNGSLLLEKQSTNLVTYSEDFSNAAWTKTEVTISANNTTSPDGTTNADAVIESTTSSAYHRVLPTNPFSGTGGAYYSFSVYVKKKDSTRHIYWMCQKGADGIYAHFNMTTFTVNEVASAGSGSNSSASITSVGNDWYRITLSGIVSSTSGSYYNQFYFENSVNTGFNPSAYTGDGVSGFYLYGWQAESGSYPTSYIKSEGAATTRLADSCYKTGISDKIGQTQGTIFMDFNVLPSTLAGSYYLETFLNDGTSNNKVSLTYYADGRIQFVAFASGSLVVNIDLPSYGLTVGKHKFAFAYKLNDYVAYADGALVGTDTSATVPSMSALNLYDTIGGTHAVNQALVFPTRLTNAELATLTTL